MKLWSILCHWLLLGLLLAAPPALLSDPYFQGRALNPNISVMTGELSQPLQLQLTAIDGSGPVGGLTVHFTSSQPGIVLSQEQAVSDSSGMVAVQVLVLPGYSDGYVFGELSNGGVIRFSVQVIPSPAGVYLSAGAPIRLAWQNTSTRDTGQSLQCHLDVPSPDGNSSLPATGASLTATVVSGPALLLSGSVPSNQLTLTTDTAGNATIDAFFPDTGDPDSQSVIVFSGSGASAAVLVHAFPSGKGPAATVVSPLNSVLPLAAGTPSTAPVQIRLTSPSGKPLVGVAADIIRKDADHAITCAEDSVSTDTTGLFTCHPIVTGKGGKGTVNFLLGGLIVTPDISYSVLAGDPAVIRILGGNRQKGTAGADLPVSLTAQLLDSSGNLLPNIPVIWQADGATLSNAEQTSETNGTVTASARLEDRPGNATVTLQTAKASAKFTLVNTSTGHLTAASGDGQVSNPGLPFGAPLMVKVTSQDGTPLPGTTIAFQVISGDAALGAAVSTADSSGLAPVTVVAGQNPGIIRILASVGLDSTEFHLFTVVPAATSVDVADQNGAPAALVPGALMKLIFALAPSAQVQNATATQVPFPTLLGNCRVSIGGTYSPVLSVAVSGGSATVLVQVPWELDVTKPATITFWASGAQTQFAGQPAQLAGPSLVLAGDRSHAAFYSQQLVPLPAGSVIVPGTIARVRLTGLGPLSPAASTNSTGVAGQVPQLPIFLFIDGVPVQILQAAADLTSIGVMNVSFIVPDGLASGAHSLWAGTLLSDALAQSAAAVIELR